MGEKEKIASREFFANTELEIRDKIRIIKMVPNLPVKVNWKKSRQKFSFFGK